MRPKKGVSVAHQLQAQLDQALVNRAYRAYGEAMQAAQLFEVSLHLLILGLLYERSDLKTFRECIDLHAYISKETVGRLISRLNKELPSVTASFERELGFKKALELRNLLAHDYFPKYHLQWLFPTGLRRQIRHLRRIKRRLHYAAARAEHIWDVLCEKGKVDQERIIGEVNPLIPLIKELRDYDPERLRRQQKRKPISRPNRQ
jgi:hypothetical protein